MCLSKGITGGFLPMGATVCSDRIEAPFRSKNRMHTFYHGHSYTGNALACAAAIASLQIFDDEPVFERIVAIAAVHAQRLPLCGRVAKSWRCATDRLDRRRGIADR